MFGNILKQMELVYLFTILFSPYNNIFQTYNGLPITGTTEEYVLVWSRCLKSFLKRLLEVFINFKLEWLDCGIITQFNLSMALLT